MAVPPKKNAAYTFGIHLESQGTFGRFQTNPTLAAGDVKVSTDGSAYTNIASLPTVNPAGSSRVEVVLSASEMNGDLISVQFIDAAGAEWHEAVKEIETSANTIDEIKTDTAAILVDTGTTIPAQITSEINDVQTDIAALNNFDPAVDVVANVTLVDTTTTNTDMRGTDGANTVVPDNASIAAILVDTDELQTNQGNWLTATGFATEAKQDISDVKIDELHKLEGLDDANPVTTTPTSRNAGSISQVITGDGITTSTVTRP